MFNLRYLVVGTGRNGTVYYSRLLTSIGIPCGHESFFDYQGLEVALLRLAKKLPPMLSYCSQTIFDVYRHRPISPYITQLENLVAESSYMAVPYLHHECLKETEVIHVVRHPVRVVNSFVNYLKYFSSPTTCLPPNPIYEAFIYRHLPELRNYDTPYERAAMYYVLWNEMVETRKLLARLKAEDGPEPLKALLNISETNVFDNRKVNTHELPGERFAIGMLPEGEVKDRFISMGERYGYDMNENILLM
jgi:hypothetical protein